MEQCSGQINITDYLEEKKKPVLSGCHTCVCKKCLYWWSSRCPYGECYDSKRAKENPYNKAHPDKPPRTAWSEWKAQQAYWCRGGVFYPVDYCRDFVKYQGSAVEDCVVAQVQTFQDGHIKCSLKDAIGCEECIRRSERIHEEKSFSCEYMMDTGCERMIAAKNLMLDAILEGEDIRKYVKNSAALDAINPADTDADKRKEYMSFTQRKTESCVEQIGGSSFAEILGGKAMGKLGGCRLKNG